MLSEKHFRALATAIYAARKEDSDLHWEGEIRGNIGVTRVLASIADTLLKTHVSFDRARFLNACETGDLGRRKNKYTKGGGK